MSRVTPAHHPIRERLLRDQRRAKMTALAALTALAVLIANLVLVIHGDDSPTAATPDDAAKAQAQLRVLQWVVPALTGTLVVVSSFAGEQQRASEVSKGILGRVTLGR